MGNAMTIKSQNAHPCVKLRRLSHCASFNDDPFGLCMRVRNDKLKKSKTGTRRIYLTHMPGRHSTADCNQFQYILRSRQHNECYEILCRSIEPFRIYKGLNVGVSHRNGNGPYHIGMRYRAAM
jgi:hypothetical protein